MPSPLTAEQIERGKVLDQRDEERLDLLDTLLSRLAEVVGWAEDEKIDTERRRSGRQEAFANLPKAPRTWSLPPEPGPEVKAVRCTCCDITWKRLPAADPTERDGWGHGELDFDGELVGMSWSRLVFEHSEPEFPLTDATETGADQ